MSLSVQTILVAIAVVVAAGYVVRSLVRRAGHGGGGCECDAGPCGTAGPGKTVRLRGPRAE